MLEIQDPFGIKGIPLKPEMKGRLKVDETLIQSLAAIMGYDGEARRLITCALQGSLHTITAPVTGILNLVSTGADEDKTFADRPITEVMMAADITNGGMIWVNVRASAGENVGWGLASGDMVRFSINNMMDLQIWFQYSGHRLIIIQAG